MTTTIYFYSATGNSFEIARTIAREIGDARVLPIAHYRKEKAIPDTAKVGIVFPVHAWGPPRTVSEFLQNLDLRGVRYTFAIASCGGTAAGTLPKLRRAVRKNGGELHAGFIVRSKGLHGERRQQSDDQDGQAAIRKTVRHLGREASRDH